MKKALYPFLAVCLGVVIFTAGRATAPKRDGDHQSKEQIKSSQDTTEEDTEFTESAQTNPGIIRWTRYDDMWVSPGDIWAPQCPHCNKVWVEPGTGQFPGKLPILRGEICPFCQRQVTWENKVCPNCDGGRVAGNAYVSPNRTSCGRCWGEGIITQNK